MRRAILPSVAFVLAACAATHGRSERDDAHARSAQPASAASGGRHAPPAARAAAGADATDLDRFSDPERDALEAMAVPGRVVPDLVPGLEHCNAHAASTLPGVSVQFASDTRCEFTRHQARESGFIDYEVAVEHKVSGVASYILAANNCQSGIAGLTFTEEVLHEGVSSRAYDHSRCGSPEPVGIARRALFPDTSTQGVVWYTTVWESIGAEHPRNAPPDEPQPGDAVDGDALAPGVYRFMVRAQGVYQAAGAADGAESPFEIIAYLDITLTD